MAERLHGQAEILNSADSKKGGTLASGSRARKGANEFRAQADREDYSRGSEGSGGEEVVLSNRLAEFGGGVGAARPAVWEPSPSFCRVGASSLPVGFKPLDP